MDDKRFGNQGPVSQYSTQTQGREALSAEVTGVLRNTYMLLGLTLAFSAVTAGTSMALNLPHPGLILTLVAFYGLLFATYKLKNSGWGLVTTFALTGFMGYTLGPILNMFVATGAGSLVTTALGMTATIFLSLSAYCLITRKDFSFLGGFIFAGAIVLMGTMLVAYLFNLPNVQLAVSAGFTLFASACILYQTSAIINGGERNYVLAAIGLYVSIYNLFMSLLHLLMAFSGDN
ncbi:MAG: Bax inhibitor-1/YccA family protein [Oleiphilaceae bacterium]|nr:Bax inhibitor-1/YccA family protein [Oleiphilaceae bacterium]